MRGITPIISVILLIAIAAAAAVMIAAWQSSFLADYVGSINEQSRLRALCRDASANLAAATFDCNSDCSEGVAHSISAIVHNDGESSLQLGNVFLLLSSGELYEIPLEQNLAAGSSRTITAETRKECSAVINNVAEIMIPTQCTALAAKLPGNEIEWVNCG